MKIAIQEVFTNLIHFICHKNRQILIQKRRKRLVLQLAVCVLQRKRSLTMVAELPGFGFAPGEDKGNESEPELETSKMVQVRPAK